MREKLDAIFKGYFNYHNDNGQAGTQHVTVSDLHEILWALTEPTELTEPTATE